MDDLPKIVLMSSIDGVQIVSFHGLVDDERVR